MRTEADFLARCPNCRKTHDDGKVDKICCDCAANREFTCIALVLGPTGYAPCPNIASFKNETYEEEGVAFCGTHGRAGMLTLIPRYDLGEEELTDDQ